MENEKKEFRRKESEARILIPIHTRKIINDKNDFFVLTRN